LVHPINLITRKLRTEFVDNLPKNICIFRPQHFLQRIENSGSQSAGGIIEELPEATIGNFIVENGSGVEIFARLDEANDHLRNELTFCGMS